MLRLPQASETSTLRLSSYTLERVSLSARSEVGCHAPKNPTGGPDPDCPEGTGQGAVCTYQCAGRLAGHGRMQCAGGGEWSDWGGCSGSFVLSALSLSHMRMLSHVRCQA